MQQSDVEGCAGIWVPHARRLDATLPILGRQDGVSSTNRLFYRREFLTCCCLELTRRALMASRSPTSAALWRRLWSSTDKIRSFHIAKQDISGRMEAVKTRGVLGGHVLIIAARCVHLPRWVPLTLCGVIYTVPQPPPWVMRPVFY